MKKFFAAFFDKKFLKFCLVGVANTLFGTGVMYALYNLAGCSYWLSSAMNYILGSILSYFLNKYYTFQYKKRDWGTILRFAANIAVCYLIAYGAAKPLVRSLLEGAGQKVQDNVAMLVGMVLFVALNYLGQRFFAFREPEAGADAPAGEEKKPEPPENGGETS